MGSHLILAWVFIIDCFEFIYLCVKEFLTNELH